MAATPYFDFKDAAPAVDDVIKAITEVAAAEKKPLTDESLQKYRALSDPHAVLMAYATGDDARTAFPGAGDAQLTKDQAKLLGKVLTTLDADFEQDGHPEKKRLVTAVGSDGNHDLRSKELSAYLQTATQSNDGKALQPVDVWAKEKHVLFTQKPTEVKAGPEETLLIETPPGYARITTGGGVGEPIDGAYARVKEVGGNGGHAALNVYLSKPAYDQVNGGHDYAGPIFVMEQMKLDKTGKKVPDEPKVGYAKDVNEFQHTLASGWKDPQDFVKKNEGTYIPLTAEQYKLFKEEFKTNHDGLTVEGFAKEWNTAHPNAPIAEVKPTAITVAAEPGKTDAVATPDPAKKPDEAGKAPLSVKGANVKVAAWQEAMETYAKKHDIKIDDGYKVDGLWGKRTDHLFKALGGNAQEILSKMRHEGIVLHPEHFEVAGPDHTPPNGQKETQVHK